MSPYGLSACSRAVARLARTRSRRASRRTTSRSAWYCANDRLSRWWACSLVYVPTRLAAMLYVGRNAERRWNVRLAARAATCSKGTNGLHSTTAWPSSSIPAPARPVSWVYSPGRQHLVVVAGELGQLLDDDGAGRHVDADGERLGGEHDLDQALDEARLDGLLERRHHPGVVGGDPGLELGEELSVAEHGEVVVGEAFQAGVDDLADAVALGAGRQAQARRRGRTGRLVALVAAEDEHDRRQQLALLEQVDGLDPARRVEHPAAAAARRPLVRRRPPHRRGVEAARRRGWAGRRRTSPAGAGGRSCGRRRGSGRRGAPAGAARRPASSGRARSGSTPPAPSCC